MGVGGVVNATDVNEALDHGYDLIAVGRATIAYPDWTDRIAAGESTGCLWTVPDAKN